MILQVRKLVMELDTLYESSDQQLSGGPQQRETRAGDSAIESVTTEITKTAKLLPELRVSLTDFSHLSWYFFILSEN